MAISRVLLSTYLLHILQLFSSSVSGEVSVCTFQTEKTSWEDITEDGSAVVWRRKQYRKFQAEGRAPPPEGNYVLALELAEASHKGTARLQSPEYHLEKGAYINITFLLTGSRPGSSSLIVFSKEDGVTKPLLDLSHYRQVAHENMAWLTVTRHLGLEGKAQLILQASRSNGSESSVLLNKIVINTAGPRDMTTAMSEEPRAANIPAFYTSPLQPEGASVILNEPGKPKYTMGYITANKTHFPPTVTNTTVEFPFSNITTLETTAFSRVLFLTTIYPKFQTSNAASNTGIGIMPNSSSSESPLGKSSVKYTPTVINNGIIGHITDEPTKNITTVEMPPAETYVTYTEITTTSVTAGNIINEEPTTSTIPEHSASRISTKNTIAAHFITDNLSGTEPDITPASLEPVVTTTSAINSVNSIVTATAESIANVDSIANSTNAEEQIMTSTTTTENAKNITVVHAATDPTTVELLAAATTSSDVNNTSQTTGHIAGVELVAYTTTVEPPPEPMSVVQLAAVLGLLVGTLLCVIVLTFFNFISLTIKL